MATGRQAVQLLARAAAAPIRATTRPFSAAVRPVRFSVLVPGTGIAVPAPCMQVSRGIKTLKRQIRDRTPIKASVASRLAASSR